MNQESRELYEIFSKATSIPESDRAQYIERACKGDPDLKNDVEELLKHHDQDQLLPRTSPGKKLLAAVRKQFEGLDSLELPDRVGPYKIIDVIGEGGMGLVFRAEQENPQRQIALKLIRPGYLSASTLRRFNYEVAILGRLQHPGIAQILEASTAELGHGVQPYFAMEFIDGDPILDYAEREKLTTRARLELMAKVADAVHHAHQKGIIHRDLKPSNILVDKAGQPKVLDFGIAKATDSDISTATMETDIGQIVGTIAYMSPEQAEGDPRNIDTRSDVYALGVVLYELLAGRKPYAVHDRLMHEALRVIREEEPTPLSSVHKVFRGDIETIASKALEKDREVRYASAEKLGDDIRRYLSNEPIVARPANTMYQIRKFAQRNRVLVGGVAMTLMALIVGMIVSLLLLDRATKAEAKAKESKVAETLAKEQAKSEANRALSVSAIKLVQELKDDAKELWPRRPETVDEMNDWLKRSSELVAGLGDYRDFLNEAESESNPEMPRRQRLWLREQLSALVSEFEVLMNENPEIGLIADVRDRLEYSLRVKEATVNDYEEEWSLSIESIATAPVYDGLRIEPHVGLVPLRSDSHSRLWEFLVLETGKAPEAGLRNRWVITEETGIILVLIPGGEFVMGAQKHDPSEYNYDENLRPTETPVDEVVLEPFFISKYEMTQAQWARLMKTNPSENKLGPVNPVESVNRDDCLEALRRLDLMLPTEAQWEFAARAGTNTPWSTGDDRGSLESFANLLDKRTQETNKATMQWGVAEAWSDNWVFHAPVGSFLPNEFGLHDMHGNVWEWVRDNYAEHYEHNPPAEGDGFREGHPKYGVYRGGCYGDGALECRSACRQSFPPELIRLNIGLRPASKVQFAD